MTNEARKIDYALRRHENGQYCMFSLDWCANRLDWAWKWRKVTEAEKDWLADRIIALYNVNLKGTKR